MNRLEEYTHDQCENASKTKWTSSGGSGVSDEAASTTMLPKGSVNFCHLSGSSIDSTIMQVAFSSPSGAVEDSGIGSLIVIKQALAKLKSQFIVSSGLSSGGDSFFKATENCLMASAASNPVLTTRSAHFV